MEFKTALEEFLYFLKAPIFNYKKDQPLDFITATKLYFLVFVFEMLVFIPVSAIIGLEGIPHAMEGLMEKNSLIMMILLAVVLAPISEEFLFRFHLRYNPLIVLFVAIVAIVLAGLVYNYYSPETFESLQEISQLQALVVSPFGLSVVLILALLAMIIGYLLVKGSKYSLVEKEFPFIFYLTALVFGMVHISNFGLDPDKWYLAPLLVLPQLILACYLGYIRIRNNIGYSIYIHALNNAIPMFLFSLGMQ